MNVTLHPEVDSDLLGAMEYYEREADVDAAWLSVLHVEKAPKKRVHQRRRLEFGIEKGTLHCPLVCVWHISHSSANLFPR